ncbi:MAG: molybdopterin-synthase adenylyltransferase MoeB [Devosia sp.]
MSLAPEETQRYARHLVLKDLGGAGQQKLKAAKVAVLGAGGLGSPAILYLAAAGIGGMTIIDDDVVALSNLQRQVIHRTDAVGTGKATSAAEFVTALNPHVAVKVAPERLDDANAERLLAGHDIVLDGSDSFATRRTVARAAEALRLPLVAGAVSTLDGQVTVFAPDGPQFSALYPDAVDEADLPSCEIVGVLGAVTGVIGTLMAMEAIKLLTGIGEPLVGRLLVYDGRGARFSEIAY